MVWAETCSWLRAFSPSLVSPNTHKPGKELVCAVQERKLPTVTGTQNAHGQEGLAQGQVVFSALGPSCSHILHYRNAKGIQTTKDRLACPAGPLYPHPQCHLSFHPPYSQSFRKALCGQSTALTTLLPRTIAFLPARSYFCLHCPMTIFSRKTSSFQMCCPRPSRALCHIIWGGCLHLGRKGFFHPAI